MTERERYQEPTEYQEPAATRQSRPSPVFAPERKPIVAPHVLLGVGLGGFFDGIVLHQILQWHHLISQPYPPTNLQNLQLNTLADGLFHAVTWSLTLLGLLWLWRMARRTGRYWSSSAFVGGLLAGWGLFNVLDEVVNHALLNTHHIRPGPDQFAWDMGFTGWGLLMLLGGWLLIRRGYKERAGSA